MKFAFISRQLNWEFLRKMPSNRVNVNKPSKITNSGFGTCMAYFKEFQELPISKNFNKKTITNTTLFVVKICFDAKCSFAYTSKNNFPIWLASLFTLVHTITCRYLFCFFVFLIIQRDKLLFYTIFSAFFANFSCNRCCFPYTL